MEIRRIRARLHDEDVRAAHVFQNLKINLAIAELSKPGFTRFGAQVSANILGQARVGAATENFKLVVDQLKFPWEPATLNRSGEIRPAHFTAVFFPPNKPAVEKLILLVCPTSPARPLQCFRYFQNLRRANRQTSLCLFTSQPDP